MLSTADLIGEGQQDQNQRREDVKTTMSIRLMITWEEWGEEGNRENGIGRRE